MIDVAATTSGAGGLASAVGALVVIMVAGGFGGLVDGLTRNRTYNLRIGKRQTNIGSLGDVLVGMTSGLAIFTVAGALLNISWSGMWQTDQLLRIVAWGVLSGYAGNRLLDPLSEKTIKTLVSDAATAAAQKVTVRSIEVEVGLRDADRQLTKYDLQEEELLAKGRGDELAQMLEAVLRQYDVVLQKDASNAEAMRGRAKVFRRKAELAGANADQASKNWELAIRELTGMIKNDNGAELAYYNRACYRCLMKASDADVIADLQAAISRNEKIREYAQTDPDFSRLRQNARFVELVGGATAAQRRGDGGSPQRPAANSLGHD